MSDPNNTNVVNRLRAYGQVLEREIDEPSAERQTKDPKFPRHRHVLAAAAAVAIAIGGGALFVGLDRNDVTVAGPTTTVTESAETTAQDPSEGVAQPAVPPAPSGIDPAPDAATFPGVAACADWFGERADQQIMLESPPNFDPRTETDDVIVLPLPATRSSVQVILTGPDGFYSCRTSRADGTTEDFTAGPGDVSPPLETDQIRFVSQGWTSDTNSGQTGPGSLTTIGRIGSDVTAVWVTIADGTDLPGLITDDGWFTIDGHIPTGVALFDEKYHWQLTDGTVTTADGETLRPTGPTEQCAATPGCIEERLAELQAEAEQLDAQAAALSDGQIDPEEQQAAHRAYVDCLIEAGIDAETSGDGFGISIDFGPGTPDNARELQIECGQQHNDLVTELANLRNAEAQIAND